jgi:hypothetical protein
MIKDDEQDTMPGPGRNNKNKSYHHYYRAAYMQQSFMSDFLKVREPVVVIEPKGDSKESVRIASQETYLANRARNVPKVTQNAQAGKEEECPLGANSSKRVTRFANRQDTAKEIEERRRPRKMQETPKTNQEEDLARPDGQRVKARAAPEATASREAQSASVPEGLEKAPVTPVRKPSQEKQAEPGVGPPSSPTEMPVPTDPIPEPTSPVDGEKADWSRERQPSEATVTASESEQEAAQSERGEQELSEGELSVISVTDSLQVVQRLSAELERSGSTESGPLWICSRAGCAYAIEDRDQPSKLVCLTAVEHELYHETRAIHYHRLVDAQEAVQDESLSYEEKARKADEWVRNLREKVVALKCPSLESLQCQHLCSGWLGSECSIPCALCSDHPQIQHVCQVHNIGYALRKEAEDNGALVAFNSRHPAKEASTLATTVAALQQVAQTPLIDPDEVEEIQVGQTIPDPESLASLHARAVQLGLDARTLQAKRRFITEWCDDPEGVSCGKVHRRE